LPHASSEALDDVSCVIERYRLVERNADPGLVQTEIDAPTVCRPADGFGISPFNPERVEVVAIRLAVSERRQRVADRLREALNAGRDRA
jgi:hypothetical protein